jgi:hypothetical protein
MAATQTMHKHDAARFFSFSHFNRLSVNYLLHDHFSMLWLIEKVEAGLKRHSLGNGDG